MFVADFCVFLDYLVDFCMWFRLIAFRESPFLCVFVSIHVPFNSGIFLGIGLSKWPIQLRVVTGSGMNLSFYVKKVVLYMGGIN